MAAKRRRWRSWQGFMDPARFVFLDETSTATNMARRYGRCPVSQRLVAAGFGEFQPIDTDRTDEAFTRNRRIELKLTER